MPKKILFVFLFALLSLPIFAQLNRVAAENVPLTSPITGPVTGPTLTPSVSPTNTPTPPITSPVSYFSLIGHITYNRIGFFMRTLPRLFPAENVKVVVRSFFGNFSQKTTTDSQGNYKMTVPPGLYQVSVEDSNHTFFVPPFRFEYVKANKTTVANFQGLLFR